MGTVDVDELEVVDAVVIEIKKSLGANVLISRRVDDFGPGRLCECEHAHSGCAGRENIHVEMVMGQLGKVGCLAEFGRPFHKVLLGTRRRVQRFSYDCRDRYHRSR
jgi:hypothetical protein